MEYGPILDWWVIPHVAFFVFLASTITAAFEPRPWVHLVVLVALSTGWEAAEYFLSRAYPETWVVLESPLNAYVVDPLSNGFGYLVGALIGAWSKRRSEPSELELPPDVELVGVTVGFSTTRKLASRVIRWVTRAPCSHAWIAFHDATLETRLVMQAEAWGFEVRPWARWRRENLLVAEFRPTGAELDVVRLGTFLGSRYDYTAAVLAGLYRLLGRFLRGRFRDPRKLMCSEAVVRTLGWSGYAAVEDLDPDLTPPGRLLLRVLEHVGTEFEVVRVDPKLKLGSK